MNDGETDNQIGYGIVGTLVLILFVVLVCIKLGCIRCWACPDRRCSADMIQSQTQTSQPTYEEEGTISIAIQSELQPFSKNDSEIAWPTFYSI